MKQKLINAIIVKVQQNASAKYGADTPKTIEIVRACNSELIAAPTTLFTAIETKYLRA